jgi:hypothetical protein
MFDQLSFIHFGSSAVSRKKLGAPILWRRGCEFYAVLQRAQGTDKEISLSVTLALQLFATKARVRWFFS